MLSAIVGGRVQAWGVVRLDIWGALASAALSKGAWTGESWTGSATVLHLTAKRGIGKASVILSKAVCHSAACGRSSAWRARPSWSPGTCPLAACRVREAQATHLRTPGTRSPGAHCEPRAVGCVPGGRVAVQEAALELRGPSPSRRVFAEHVLVPQRR